jgi:sulfonate transport system permease protein
MSSLPFAERETSAATAVATLPPRWRRACLNGALVRFLLAWPVPLGLFVLWTATARHGWIAEQILPGPDMVLATFLDLLHSGDLASNLSISLVRIALGGFVGIGAGLLLGATMGLSPALRDYLYPTFRAFAQVPALGWIPLLMMVLGIGETLKIVLIAKACFVPVTVNTCKGIENVSGKLLEVARVYRMNPWQQFAQVILPAAFPSIWGGVRYGLTHAWLGLVAVELLASSEGLGFLIVYGRQLYQMDVVMAAVVVVGLVGFALDKVLALIEVRVLRHWRHEVVRRLGSRQSGMRQSR